MELGIATPQIVLNYVALLEEKNYFEDSFTVRAKRKMEVLLALTSLLLSFFLFSHRNTGV